MPLLSKLLKSFTLMRKNWFTTACPAVIVPLVLVIVAAIIASIKKIPEEMIFFCAPSWPERVCQVDFREDFKKDSGLQHPEKLSYWRDSSVKQLGMRADRITYPKTEALKPESLFHEFPENTDAFRWFPNYFSSNFGVYPVVTEVPDKQAFEDSYPVDKREGESIGRVWFINRNAF